MPSARKDAHRPLGSAGRFRLGFAALVGVCGLAGGLLGVHLAGGLSSAPAPPAARPAPEPPREVLGRPAPALSLPDGAGRVRGLGEWRGRVLVVNFWATWCGPCRDEIPLLVSLQSDYRAQGLQVIGIAVDHPEAVAEFEGELSMNYPSLFAAREAFQIGVRFGNPFGSLPYTVVLDREGVVRYTHLGVVRPGTLEPILRSLLSG